MRGGEESLFQTVDHASYFSFCKESRKGAASMGLVISKEFPVGYPFLLLSTSSPSAFFSLLTVCLQKKIWISSVSTCDQGCLANRNRSWLRLQGYGTCCCCFLLSQATSHHRQQPLLAEKASHAKSQGLVASLQPTARGRLRQLSS